MFIGTLIAGFVDAFVPPQMMERILPRNKGVAIGLSVLLRFRTSTTTLYQTAFAHRKSGEIVFRNSTDDEQTWIWEHLASRRK